MWRALWHTLQWFEHHEFLAALATVLAMFVVACVAVVASVVWAGIGLARDAFNAFIMDRCKRCKREGRVW